VPKISYLPIVRYFCTTDGLVRYPGARSIEYLVNNEDRPIAAGRNVKNGMREWNIVITNPTLI